MKPGQSTLQRGPALHYSVDLRIQTTRNRFRYNMENSPQNIRGYTDIFTVCVITALVFRWDSFHVCAWSNTTFSRYIERLSVISIVSFISSSFFTKALNYAFSCRRVNTFSVAFYGSNSARDILTAAKKWRKRLSLLKVLSFPVWSYLSTDTSEDVQTYQKGNRIQQTSLRCAIHDE